MAVAAAWAAAVEAGVVVVVGGAWSVVRSARSSVMVEANIVFEEKRGTDGKRL